MTSKRQFQQLAEMHAADALTLLQARRYTNAVHLAGLSVECALKALICDHFREGVLPDRNLVNQAYKHQPDQLVSLAGIQARLDEKNRDPEFKARWAIMKVWSIETRYDTISEAEAIEVLDAAVGRQGVLEWIKTFW